MTGLLPGTTYELTVVAVSQGGDVVAEGQASGPIINTTRVTGLKLYIEIKYFAILFVHLKQFLPSHAMLQQMVLSW